MQPKEHTPAYFRRKKWRNVFFILFFTAPACPLWTGKGDAARRGERGVEQLESKMAGWIVFVYA